MKRLVLALLTLTLAFTVGLVACSDDKSTSPGGQGSIGDSDAATANAIAYGIVLPLIQDLFIETYIDQIVTAPSVMDQRFAGGHCTPLEFCTSGSAEICTGPGTFDLNFTNCGLDATTIDGSVSMTFTTSSGSGTFSLTVGGDFAISGSTSYDFDTECFNQYFTDVVITANNLTINMGGSASWCTPRAMVGSVVVPTFANFVFEIPSLEQVVDVNIFEDPAGSLQVVILDINRTNVLYICDGNIAGNSLSCATGTE